MPGNGRKGIMFMRFQVQLFDAAAARWHNLDGADSGFVELSMLGILGVGPTDANGGSAILFQAALGLGAKGPEVKLKPTQVVRGPGMLTNWLLNKGFAWKLRIASSGG